jgi:hypothetical protein
VDRGSAEGKGIMAELSEETKTLLTALRHQTLVKKYLLRLAHRLEERALLHDLSKFQLDEFEGFVEINQIARKHKYGSPEYQASITSDAVALHLSRNSHHPEHHHGGIKDMRLLDLMEMVVDWLAASETYGKTTFGESLQIQKDRFKITDEQYRLIQLIAEEITK